jgi:hypothetical protein
MGVGGWVGIWQWMWCHSSVPCRGGGGWRGFATAAVMRGSGTGDMAAAASKVPATVLLHPNQPCWLHVPATATTSTNKHPPCPHQRLLPGPPPPHPPGLLRLQAPAAATTPAACSKLPLLLCRRAQRPLQQPGATIGPQGSPQQLPRQEYAWVEAGPGVGGGRRGGWHRLLLLLEVVGCTLAAL